MVVAPCFDKKLEAVREEFYNSMLETRDVDCVLTSGKIFKKTIFATILEFVRPLSLVSAEHIYCLDMNLKPEDCLCSGKAELLDILKRFPPRVSSSCFKQLQCSAKRS